MTKLHVNESQNTLYTADCKDERQFICEVVFMLFLKKSFLLKFPLLK
jgi:hypothetical protein